MNKRVGFVRGGVFVIPLTKGFETIVDLEDSKVVSGFNWTALVLSDNRVLPKVYAYRKVSILGKQTIVYLHRNLLFAPAGHEIDHINGNSLDNTRSNLRVVTKQQNKFNRGALSNNTSGYKGVSWCKQKKKWKAAISVNGKTLNLGSYEDIKEASFAYEEVSNYYHGHFGRL